ncbi:MAG TPA: NUDIX hydrolase [Thermoleophilaceae bacterium]|nr:NUDIX hydrolase [Thermoleophilaceae bacterium]
MSTEREVSYGGVVVRGDEMIVIVPRGRRRVLGLPKGGANPGETPEQTAEREVREETGITARASERLGQVDYSYRRGGRVIAKTVHFYLCRFEAGDTADHDHEVDDARWMPLREARRRLSYPGERAMVERALSVLAANG